jgi:Flp pilus assembly protein TadD
MLLARTGRDEEAYGEFRRAGCTDAEAKNNLAFALLLKEDWRAAGALYEQALAQSPHLSKAETGMAAARKMLQNADPAPPPYRLPPPSMHPAAPVSAISELPPEFRYNRVQPGYPGQPVRY